MWITHPVVVVIGIQGDTIQSLLFLTGWRIHLKHACFTSQRLSKGLSLAKELLKARSSPPALHRSERLRGLGSLDYDCGWGKPEILNPKL